MALAGSCGQLKIDFERPPETEEIPVYKALLGLTPHQASFDTVFVPLRLAL